MKTKLDISIHEQILGKSNTLKFLKGVEGSIHLTGDMQKKMEITFHIKPVILNNLPLIQYFLESFL